MITNRRTVQVKQGHMEAYTAMILAEAKNSVDPGRFRLYASDVGPLNQLVLEIDFADLAAYERFWRDWVSVDPILVFQQKYSALVDHNISSEIWDLTT